MLRVGAALLLAAALLACSSSDRSLPASSSTTVVDPTTTGAEPTSAPTSTVPPTSTVATTPPTTGVAAQERPQCRGIPANSSAFFDAAGGIYATFLTAFDADADAGLVGFDVIQWLTGDEAKEAFIEEYGGDEGPPNGYHVKNENDLVRQAPLAADAEFWIVQLDVDADADVDRTDLAGMADARDRGYDFDIYWLTFEAGEITEICQQYVP